MANKKTFFSKLVSGFGYKKVSKSNEEKSASTLGALFGIGQDQNDEMGSNKQANYKNYMEKYENLVWVYACCHAKTSDIAGVPLRIFKTKIVKGKLVKVDIPDHPLHDLLDVPNDLKVSGFDFKEAIVANGELTGNIYIFLDELGANGIPGKIYCMNSSLVEIVKAPTKVAGYKYHVDGQIREYSADEIIRGRYYSPTDEFYGCGSIAASRMSIQGEEKANDYNFAFFNNGARDGGVFSTEHRLGDVEWKRLVLQIKENYAGNKNAFKPFILEKGLKYDRIGVTRKDMEFIEGKKMNREDILACFGVPPIRVGLLEHANYSNAKEQIHNYWMNTLIPDMERILSIYKELLMLFGDENVDCEFDLSKVEALRADEKLRMENVKGYFSVGIPMNVLIDWFNLPIEKRPEWDKSYLPVNLLPITPAGEGEEEPEPEEEESSGSEEDKRFEKLINRTEEDYRVVDVFIKRTEIMERKHIEFLQKYFGTQRRKVLTNLAEYKSIELTEDIAGEYKLEAKKWVRVEGSRKRVEKVKVDIENILFDVKTEAERYHRDSLPVMRETVKQQAEAEIARLELGISFDVENPRVIEYLKKYGIDEGWGIGKTTTKKLRNTLIQGMREGETIESLASRIRIVYRDATKIRSLSIARTEVINASNFGAIESYEQSGIVEGWEWLTAKDELVCEICEAVDGNEYELKEIASRPPAHPSCRCTVLPMIKKER